MRTWASAKPMKQEPRIDLKAFRPKNSRNPLFQGCEDVKVQKVRYYFSFKTGEWFRDLYEEACVGTCHGKTRRGGADF